MKHWKPSCKSHTWDQDKSDGYNGWLDSDSNLSIYRDNKIEVQTCYLEYMKIWTVNQETGGSIQHRSIIGCRWGWPTHRKNWGEKHSPHSGNDMCMTNVQCNWTTWSPSKHNATTVGGRVGTLSVEWTAPSTMCRASRIEQTHSDPTQHRWHCHSCMLSICKCVFVQDKYNVCLAW